LNHFISRLLGASFLVCLGLALVGAVVLERHQLQQRIASRQKPAAGNDIQVATAEPLPGAASTPGSVTDRATASRSRVGRAAGDPAELFTVDKDIAYGSQPRQTLDLYTPTKPRADGKAVVFFYGGGWKEGSKAENESIGKLLASQGIVTVIPDYRLFPEVRFPAFIEDGARAVRWAADHIGVDKLFLMGHSAGAHMAMMLAANSPYLAQAGVDRLKLRGAIGLSGPYDLLPFQNNPYMLDAFLGGRNPEIYPEAFAQGPLPAVLLVQGAADTVIDPGNTERFAAAWRKARGQAVVKLYAGVDHMDTQQALVDPAGTRIPVRDDVLGFIETH